MPRTVTVPGVGDVEFPDGMSDADVTAAIQRDIMPRASVAAKPTPQVATPQPAPRNPAAARVANIQSAKKEQGAWWDAADYAAAVAGAVRGLLPDFGADYPANQVANTIETATNFGVRYATGHKAQAITGLVPIVGEPLAELAGPSIAYREGRAPTHQENVSAVGGGVGLAALILAPKMLGKAAEARQANIRAARGLAPTEAAPAVEPSIDAAKPEIAPPPLSEGQVDRLASDARLGNPNKAAVPAKLREAILSGTFKGDVTPENMARYLADHPDVAREVSASYDTKLAPDEMATTKSARATSEQPVSGEADGLLMAHAPTIAEATTAAKRLGPIKEFMDGVAPASASADAAAAADVVRNAKADVANEATIERVQNSETLKTFAKASDAENVENISAYERTGQFQNAPSGYSEMYRETTDTAHKTLQEVYGDDRVGYVDNYVRRAFKFGSDADAAKATGVLSNWIRSLSASKSPLQGRVLGVPLDEALGQMRAAGIHAEPVTTNPEVLRQWTVENANQARAYKQAWDEAKESKLIQFVRQGDRVPHGLVELNDRVARVFRPTDEGMVQTGRYFAEPGVARIFNNAISTGLGGSPTFRAIRAMNNAYNQVQLGLSAFHLTGTAINAGISDFSLGLEQIISGDVGAGAKSIGRSAVPTMSFARDMFRGREFINDLVADDPAARKVLAEVLNPAGGRLGVEQSYRNSAVENMTKAWSNRRYVRALGNAPLAVIQKIASPLMDYAIPRVKIGAFLDLAEAGRARLGHEATPVQIRRAYQQAWDSIDNRFGQIVHDNLFWNRTAADLAQVSTRSVGWNLGTVRELGGGAVDLAKGDISRRTLYSFALPLYTGTIGAVYMFLHTGKGPSSLRDYFYPENGLKDDKGRNGRITLPTYMKDVYAYSSHPVLTLEHKASPLLSLAADLGTNRDYFGDMIRNPEESRSRQLLQMGTYAMKQFRPFSIQQAAKTAQEGGPVMAGEQFFGFVKAPAEMRMDPAESDAMREARRLRNENVMKRNAKRHN